MKPIRKHALLALGAAGLLFAGAGTAGAGAAAGPPTWSQHQGLRQAGLGLGVQAGGVVMDAAADYLGLTETALAAERHDGASLAQIAVAQGKTSAGLQQALVTAFKAHLDEAVGAGTLTQAQATQALAHFKTQVQTLVERTTTGPVAGRGGHGAGLGTGVCDGRR